MSSTIESSGDESESAKPPNRGPTRTSGAFSRNPKEWVFGKSIGEGAYGKVKEIIETRSKKRYAVKILTQKKLRNIPGGEESILREISIMQKINHKNCIQFVDYWHDEVNCKSYLVLEYVGGGSLQEFFDQISPFNGLPHYQARKLFKQLMEALKHVHSMKIIHRDVKPENVMLSSKRDKLKLSDFGIAHCPAEKGDSPSDDDADNPRKRCYGSPAYQSPEVTSGKGPAFSTAVDVWAAGVILYQLCFGKYPFQSASENFKGSQKGLKETLNGLCQCKFTIPEGTDAGLASLLKGMLDVDPQRRLTVSQVRSSSWIKMKMKKVSKMPEASAPAPKQNCSSFLGSSIKFVKCNLNRNSD